jgi:hypothetical protein
MWQTLKNMQAIVSNAPNYASSSPVLPDLRLRSVAQRMILREIQGTFKII